MEYNQVTTFEVPFQVVESPGLEMEVQYRYYTDGVDTFRKGVLDGEFVIDDLAFVDFEIPAGVVMGQYHIYTDGTVTYRDGIRDGSFVLDMTLTATGFEGTIEEDWVNVNTY